MKQYHVTITGKALADMEAIYDYIASTFQAPDTAMRQYDRIAAEIQSLTVFPERCRLLDTAPEHTMGLRQLMVDSYSAIYVVREDTVTVLRVLYSSSSISEKLKSN